MFDFIPTITDLKNAKDYIEYTHKLLKAKYDKGDGELHNNYEYIKECDVITTHVANLTFQIRQLTNLDIERYQRCDDNLQFGLWDDYKKEYFFREFDRVNHRFTFNQLKDGKIKMEEVWSNCSLWKEMSIDLNDYTDKQKEDYIYGYYENMDECIQIYGDDFEGGAPFILAEIIFENENGLYPQNS